MTPASEIDPADLAQAIARGKIADVLTRYCRGIDRCEIDTLTAVFWPEASCDYGSGAQNAVNWAKATVAALKGMLRTMHSVSNMIIDIEGGGGGDRARAETYCEAYHELAGPDGRREMIVGGRYLDRLERRAGAWRIAERLYVMDWNRNAPSSCEWDTGIYASLKTRGARWPDDPLHDFLNQSAPKNAGLAPPSGP